MHSYISDWSLSIQPVSEEDQGEYICQINTEPQSITRIVLQVFHFLFLNKKFSIDF